MYKVFQRFARILYNINFINRYHFLERITFPYITLHACKCHSRIRAQKFPIHENAQDVQNFVPLSKASIEDRGEINAIYKPRCTPDCTPSVRKRYNAWSYKTFIGSLVRSIFWCELARRYNRDAKASTHGDETRHTRGERWWEGRKTRTWRRELHPALRSDAAKQARAGVNNALRWGSAISGHVPVRDFLSSAYKACGWGGAMWQELGRAQSLEELVIGNFIAISCTPSGTTFQEAKVHLLLYSSLMIGSHIQASHRLVLLKYPREIWHELTIIKFRNIRDLNL